MDRDPTRALRGGRLGRADSAEANASPLGSSRLLRRQRRKRDFGHARNSGHRSRSRTRARSGQYFHHLRGSAFRSSLQRRGDSASERVHEKAVFLTAAAFTRRETPARTRSRSRRASRSSPSSADNPRRRSRWVLHLPKCSSTNHRSEPRPNHRRALYLSGPERTQPSSCCTRRGARHALRPTR